MNEAPAAAAPAAPTPAAPPVAPPASNPARDLLIAKGLIKPQGDAPIAPGAEPAKVESEGDSRRARLLADQAAWDARKRAEATTFKAAAEKAAKWDAIETAKASDDPISALRLLWDDGTINSTLYQRLTEKLIADFRPETDEDKAAKADADIEAKVAKALEERERKQAEAAAAQREQATASFAAQVNEAFEGAADAFPLISQWGVGADRVHAVAEELFKAARASGKPRDESVPAPRAVLEEIERRMRAAAQTPTEATKQPAKIEAPKGNQAATTVTSEWTRDAGIVRPQPTKAEEITAEIKRRYFGGK